MEKVASSFTWENLTSKKIEKNNKFAETAKSDALSNIPASDQLSLTVVENEIINNSETYLQKHIEKGREHFLEIENKIPILTQAEKSCWHEAYGKEETRSAVIKHKPVVNKRKKVTNEQRQARIYSPKFKQYDKPKSLGDHYPLTTEECLELQSRSGRDFTQNAMNEILLDMSRKPKLQGHSFVSRARFMAYMATVYRYEGRDTVKTSNSSFKIMARATKSEVIAHTTQTQRDEFMATFEQAAIDFPTPENRFKAKIACTLPPMIGYNLLSSIKSISFLNDMLEICLVNQLNIDHHKQAILKEAKAVDCKIDHVLVYCS